MQFGLHNYFNKEFQYFSMMREPVNRVISQYTYILSMKDNPHNLSTESGEMTIRQYYDSGIHPQLVNGQTQLISGNILNKGTNPNVSNEFLEIAKNNIEKHFLLIGLTERFSETLLLLKRELGWKTPYYSKANVTKKKPRHSNISEEDIDFIKAKNQLDIQLYDFATDLFNEKLSSVNNDFKNELKWFNRNNKIRTVFYAMPRLKRKLSKIFK